MPNNTPWPRTMTAGAELKESEYMQLPRHENLEWERLKRQLQANGLLEENVPVYQSNDDVELSADLWDFVEPFKGTATTPEACDKLSALGVVAWNAALLEGAQRKEMLHVATEALVAIAGEEWRKGIEGILNMLIKRKEECFSSDRRSVADYHWYKEKGGYRLIVASTLRP